MSVLDTFVLLFEADTSQGKQGMEEAKRGAKDLESQLKSTDEASNKLGDSFIEMASSLGGFLAATLSFGAISAAVVGAANFADKLDETSERLGVSVENLSLWGDAAKIAGGSSEGFIASLDSLNTALTQMDVTGKSRALPFLKELGINMESAAYKGKTAMELLPEIAEAMGKMEKTQAIGIGRKLGLDMGTIMMLQSGRKSLDELLARQKELGVVTANQAEISAKFNDSLDDTSHAFRGVWLGIAESVLPALTWVMEKFQAVGKFLSKHKDFVTGIFLAIGAAITYFVVPPLISAGIAAAVAFAPFLLIGAAVAAAGLAFALLYDDIMNFIDGNDSMIGQILEKYPIIGTIIDGLVAAFNWMKESVGEVFDGLIGNVMLFISWVQKAIDFVLGLADKAKGVVSAIGGFFGFGGNEETAKAVATGQAQIAQASNNPIASQTSNSISGPKTSNKNTTVSVGKVEVNTQATDADGVARAVGGTLNNQLRQTVSNYDDGVMA